MNAEAPPAKTPMPIVRGAHASKTAKRGAASVYDGADKNRKSSCCSI